MKRMRLEQRGNLIVSFPLICQLLFVCVLLVPLFKLQAENANLAKSSDLISESVSLIFTAVNIGYIARMQASKQPSGNAFNEEKLIAGLRNKVEKIKKNAGDDAERLQLVDNIARGTEMLIDLLSSAIKDHRSGMSDFRRLGKKYDQPFKDTTAYLLNSAETFVQSEERRKLDFERKTRADWTALKQLMSVFLVLSVVIAFTLAAVYIRAILMPLQRLSANCLRIARQQELLPALDNADEFSKLDKFLHAITIATREEQQKEKAMVENTNDFICSLSDNGVFLQVNQSAFNFFGMQPDELIGMQAIELLAPDDRERANECLADAGKTAEQKTFELKVRTKKNGETYKHTRWSCLYSQKRHELFAVVHDIDEEKIIESIKQDFVDMVSHDLRSPLSSLQVAFDLLLEGAYGAVPAPAERELNRARDNIERLLEFVNDLLDFQKLKHGNLQVECEQAQVRLAAQAAVNFVKPALDAKNITLDLDENEITFFADAKKITQVLTNLLTNAIRYSPFNGTISLNWRETPDGVEISVADNGPGIAEEHQKIIFEAFEQTPESIEKAEGTGLGLAICKLICDAHKGSISLESALGQGSKFTILIPGKPG